MLSLANIAHLHQQLWYVTYKCVVVIATSCYQSVLSFVCGSSMCFLIADNTTSHPLTARVFLCAVLGGAATGRIKLLAVCPHWVILSLVWLTPVREFTSPNGRFAFTSPSAFLVATLIAFTSMVVTNEPILLHVVGIPMDIGGVAGVQHISSNELC